MSPGMRITVLDLLADLEALRVMCGFSKREVCQEIGITRQTYHNWLFNGMIPSSKFEPEFIRTIGWMQGVVEKREKKEKADAKAGGTDSL